MPAINFLLKPDRQTRSRLLSVLVDLALTQPISIEATPTQEIAPDASESEDD
jgi:hypothetical protein